MKSSDFNMNEGIPGAHYWIGDIGAAGLQQIKDRFSSKNKGAGDLPVVDRAAKNMFIRDFIGRATHAVDSGIESGLIDPNLRGGAPQVGNKDELDKPKGPTPSPNFTQPGYGNIKINQPTGITPKQPTPTPTTPTSNVPTEPKPGTPEYFAAKRKAAASAAQASMVPFSKLPADQYAKTLANTRQQKQAQAAQGAQASMVPFSKLPADQYAKTLANTRQQKQAQAAQAAQASMTPVAPVAPTTPAKARGGKVAGQLSQTPNAVRKRNARAIDRDRERLIPDYGNVKENSFLKLNAIFESIVSLDEAPNYGQTLPNYQNTKINAPTGLNLPKPQAPTTTTDVNTARTIANHLKKWFLAYTKLQSLPQDAQRQVDALIQQVQNSYLKDKGYESLNKLGHLAYTLLQTYSEELPKVAATTASNINLSSIEDIQKTIQSLDPLDLKELYKELEMREYQPPKPKQTSTRNTEPNQNAGANAFSSMASQLAKNTTNVKKPEKDEPISIGGQKLDPKNPEDAKIIARVRGTPGQGIQDIAKKKKPKEVPAAYK